MIQVCNNLVSGPLSGRSAVQVPFLPQSFSIQITLDVYGRIFTVELLSLCRVFRVDCVEGWIWFFNGSAGPRLLIS